MKRIISVLLVIAVMFSLSACGEDNVEESKTMDYIPVENTLQSDTEEASDESAEDTASDNIVSMPTWAGESYHTIREASHAAVSPDGHAIEVKDVLSAKNTVTAWLSAIGMAV